MKRVNTDITVFEDKKIRRTWENEQWYFVIEDVVRSLIDSSDAKQYIQKMKQRDVELGKGWVQIVHTLSIETSGGNQRMICANLSGIFRIIQSISSPKAEPFKLWLAKVGQERIEEIQDPEKAIVRAKNIYTSKGYGDDWISKRMRVINIRNTLTDEWKDRGAKEGLEFAILTNEIYKGTFEKTAKEIKDFKNLRNEDNPRDYMSELEIILTMLGEATTTQITKNNNSKTFPKLQSDARKGGKIAGNARKEIEQETREKVMGKNNFLGNKKQKKIKGK